MNGFSTEEDSHDGPPAPPFYGQSCCLIEDGERCGRSAGNASFSKRIQKSISQKKLKLDIDKSVRCLCLWRVSSVNSQGAPVVVVVWGCSAACGDPVGWS